MSTVASALPVTCTLRVPRERDVVFAVEFRDEANAAVDLSGDTLACAVYDARGGTKKFDATITADSPYTAGNATLTFTIANLTDAAGGETITRWFYVLDRTHAAKKAAWFEGPFEIHPVASE